MWQRKRTQYCDSDGADSNVTALTVTALGHQWLWHRSDSDVYISVTAMAIDTAVAAVTTDSAVSAVAADSAVTAMTTDSAVTAVKTDSAVTAVAADSAVTAMCTLVWQRCQLPLISQWCAHRCHTNVNIAVSATAVTALLVFTAITLVCTVVLQRCYYHRCCTVVSLHRWHTNVAAIAVTVLPLM